MTLPTHQSRTIELVSVTCKFLPSSVNYRLKSSVFPTVARMVIFCNCKLKLTHTYRRDHRLHEIYEYLVVLELEFGGNHSNVITCMSQHH